MKIKRLFAVVLASCLLAMPGIIPAVAHGPTLQPVSVAFQLTSDPHYDRNPTLFQARDGTWWLFFTRGLDSIGVRGLYGYDPDQDRYDIYYKTVGWQDGSFLGLPKATEKLLPGSDASHGQRDVTALQASDGKIWVFSSTGFGPGENHIYYFTYGGVWQGPTPIPIEEPNWIGHINALSYEGKIWVFYDAEYSLKSIYYDGTWHGPFDIAADATLGKAIVDRGKFYIVWAHLVAPDIWGDYIGLSTSSDGMAWTNHGKIMSWPGATNWDPVFIKDSDSFRLLWAPDAGNEGQFIATSDSHKPTDPTSWSTPVQVTTASYGNENWWDFWPQPCKIWRGISRPLMLVYTSEGSSDGTKRIDGNIWLRLMFAFQWSR